MSNEEYQITSLFKTKAEKEIYKNCKQTLDFYLNTLDYISKYNYKNLKKFDELEDIINNEKKDVDINYIRDYLINQCGFINNSICKIINSIKYNPGNKLLLSDLKKKPFDFITIENALVTFKRAEMIMKIEDIDISPDILHEKWLIDYFINKNSAFYIEYWLFKKKYNEEYEDFCNEYNITEDILNVKGIKIKWFGIKKYVTTDYFMNLERKMSDDMIDLYHDSEPYKYDIEDIKEYIDIIEKTENEKIYLNEQQRHGVYNLIQHKLAILTGPPGTGKTTSIYYALNVLLKYNSGQRITADNICICAPTGIAFKNLSKELKNFEINKKHIGTIHKLVYDIFPRKITEYKIKLIIVDETSMIDNLLFIELLKYCKKFDCRLWLIGDKEQLPPIGAGEPFARIIESMTVGINNESYFIDDNGNMPLTKLITNNRSNKPIVNMIEKLNRNEKITLTDFDNNYIKFCHLDEDDIDFKRNIDTIFKDNDYIYNNNDIGIITPQNGNTFGVNSLNYFIQKKYNNNEIVYNNYNGSIIFKTNDRVVRIKNEYNFEKDGEPKVNGQQGVIEGYDNITKLYKIKYDDGTYEEILETDLKDLFKLFYSATVHKLQGSGKKKIFIFIAKNHKMWNPDTPCGKNCHKLLYTALSRGKENIIIIGDYNTFIKAQQKCKVIIPTLFMKESNKGYI